MKCHSEIRSRIILKYFIHEWIFTDVVIVEEDDIGNDSLFKPLSGSEESKRLEYGSLKYNVGKNNFDSMNDTFSYICYFSNFINKV